MIAQVVELNAMRMKEENAGDVFWGRPEFQAPEDMRQQANQRAMNVDAPTLIPVPNWPRDVPSQFTVLRSALAASPASAQEITRKFTGAPRGKKITEMLETLVALGQVRTSGNRYAA